MLFRLSCHRLLLFVLIPALTLNTQSVRGTEPPTLEWIATALENQRGQVDSLSLETKEYAVVFVDPSVQNSWPGFPAYDFTYQESLFFAFKGDKRYQRTVQSMEFKPPNSEEPGVRRNTLNIEQADIDRYCWQRRVNLEFGPAQVFVTPREPRWTHIPNYCRRIGWDCKTEMFTSGESQLKDYRANDMLQLLTKGDYAIEDGVKLLDGNRCVLLQRKYEAVVTLEDNGKPQTLNATEKIWLDIDHGLVVRQRDEDIEGLPFHRYVNSDFVEITPGIWFPKKTTDQVFAPQNAAKEYHGRVVFSFCIDLIRWSVNDVNDERFDIVTKPSDIVHDVTKTPSTIRVIEDPKTPDEAAPASDASRTSTTRTQTVVLSAEAAGLIESMADAAHANSTRTRATPLHVAIVSLSGTNDERAISKILESQGQCIWKILTPAQIRTGELKAFDVVLFPGGKTTDQRDSLELEGRKAVRKFVEDGGGYIGICAGAGLAAVDRECLGLINVKVLCDKRDCPGPDGIMSVDMGVRIGATVKMELTDAGRKLLNGQPGLRDAEYYLGPIFLPGETTDLPEYVSLSEYRTETWLHKYQRGTMVNSPNILAARFGKGHVIIFSTHPESGRGNESTLLHAVLATAQKPTDHN